MNTTTYSDTFYNHRTGQDERRTIRKVQTTGEGSFTGQIKLAHQIIRV